MFTANWVFPGVCHITDAMGVSFTLVEGRDRALLFDTGYGTEDVSSYVRTLTEKPVKVLLSHGHHDHMLGARWFPETFLCEEDLEEFRLRTGREQRTKVMAQAEEKGVPVPGDFLTAAIAEPTALRFPETAGGIACASEDLGGEQVRIYKVPGHTPGSIVLYAEGRDLLLTGDDWNPCTWMWFPTSCGADVWRDRMNGVIRTIEQQSGREIRHVLCSHQPMLREAAEMKAFLAYMTDERLETAPEVDMGAPINTHTVQKEPEGWTLIFDRDKIK